MSPRLSDEFVPEDEEVEDELLDGYEIWEPEDYDDVEIQEG